MDVDGEARLPKVLDGVKSAIDDRSGNGFSSSRGDKVMGEEGYISGPRPMGGGEIAIDSGDNPIGDEGIEASREGPACDISTSVSASPAGTVWRDDVE